jgi:SAM-dependent methyltransferase
MVGLPNSHPIFARIYAKRSATEESVQGRYRKSLLQGLSGRVLEVGCGNGLNFEHYPPEVTDVFAMEPEHYLRGKAEEKARCVSQKIHVINGRAEDMYMLNVRDFDAVVFSLVLCSISNPEAALRDAKSLLRPGGEVRVYEHTLSVDNWLQRKQRFFNPLWKSLAGGCNLNRDPIAMVRDQFKIKTYKEVHVPSPLSLVTPHVLIRATNKESHAQYHARNHG